jgi:hypothetical protein
MLTRLIAYRGGLDEHVHLQVQNDSLRPIDTVAGALLSGFISHQ